jgi:hypothetical protein
MVPWIISGIAALALGLVLRHIDRRGRTRGQIDSRRITPLQVLYSCLLAYPFCVVYVLIDLAL